MADPLLKTLNWSKFGNPQNFLGGGIISKKKVKRGDRASYMVMIIAKLSVNLHPKQFRHMADYC